ncbi:MAG: AI-2E family transporter [Myxococcota bacterium]|nr:AI-2E family transporter [Myxococcota bacterium]
MPKVPLAPGENDKLHVASAVEREEVSQSEIRALTWLAAIAFGIITWIVMPVGVGILLGTLIAFSLQPLYERWKPRLGSASAALTTVVVATVGLIAAFGGLGWLVVAKGAALAGALISALGPEGGANRAILALGTLTSRLGIGPQELETRLRGLAEAAAARAAGIAEMVVAATASSLLALFFAMLTMHFILRNWNAIALRAQQTMPLRPDYTRALFEEFRRVGRTTLLGTIVTGLAQGLLATIGYWITGVPEPLFFGAATAIASLIPGVGTLLVWVPAGIVLIATGHPFGGVAELAWGAIVIVGVSDYVIRPRLVGGEGQMPALITFAALFGGVEVFGLKGLILGPVLMSLGIAVLRLYATEVRERRGAIARMRP